MESRPSFLNRLRRPGIPRTPGILSRANGIAVLLMVLSLLLSAGIVLSVPMTPAAAAETTEAAELTPFPSETAIPDLGLAPQDVAVGVNGVEYPADIVEGHLRFVRRQAEEAGKGRDFYSWGETLHLFDTVTERLLAAQAAQQAGFLVTSRDLEDFAAHTLLSSPSYLDELYGGDVGLYEWDANLQILAKKWMAQVATGVRPSSWEEAGLLMESDAEEFARWDEWLVQARGEASIATYPEHIERGSAPSPRAGIALLLLAGAALAGLYVRGVARSDHPDLLHRWSWLGWSVRTQMWPAWIQAALVAVFGLMVASLAFGSDQPHRNLGSVYLWILWWPLVPFALFLGARSWCAVCPIATLGDMAQRLPGAGVRRPGRWMIVGGVWIIDGTFLAITWLDRTAGLVGSVRLTLTALLLLSGLAITVALLFTRRTFCRHLCFFGALAGNYSLASVAELRPRRRGCRECGESPCGLGTADACPMLERPRGLTSNRNCNLCMECARGCRARGFSLRLRDPLGELSAIRHPRASVAAVAAVLVGVVAVQNLGMLEAAGVIERRVAELTGLGPTGTSSLIYLVALALPLLLLFLAAGGRTPKFAYFGYALIPLDLGSHAAHNLLHLLGEGKSIWWVTAEFLGLSTPLDVPGGHPGGSMGAALLDVSTIKVLQVALLLMAAIASLIVARRLDRRLGSQMGFRPLYGLLGIFIAANLWMLSVPMALRH